MDELRTIIAGLRRRIDGITAERARITAALQESEAAYDRILTEKSSLEEENAALKRKINALELSKSLECVSGGNKGARDRVNKLLREVDKCIALMNK